MYKSNSIWDVDTKALAELIIVPLIKSKPDKVALDTWLDDCFQVDTRHLAILKTTKALCLNGITIPKNIIVFLRIDDITNVVELQPDFADDLVFKLTREEFRRLVNSSLIGVQH